MAIADQVRSTLEDVEHAIVAADQKIQLLRAEQTQKYDGARWHEAIALDREIATWEHAAASLAAYQIARLAREGASPPATSVGLAALIAMRATLEREHETARQRAEHVDQFTTADPWRAYAEYFGAWTNLHAFTREAWVATHHEPFNPGALPPSPETLPMWLTMTLRRRALQVRAPVPDAARWAGLTGTAA